MDSTDANLFAETIAAHGGERFLNLKTLKITGKGEFTTPPQTGGLTMTLDSFTYYVAAGGRARLEAHCLLGRLLFAARGEKREGFTIMAGRTVNLPPEQINGVEVTEFLRAAAKQEYPVVAIADSEATAADGTSLIGYGIQNTRGGVTRVYVESDTKRVRKTVTRTTRGEMTALLSDYRQVEGLPIWGELQLLEDGASIFKLRTGEVTLDPYLADTLFERP